jgi:hypothetical protein
LPFTFSLQEFSNLHQRIEIAIERAPVKEIILPVLARDEPEGSATRREILPVIVASETDAGRMPCLPPRPKR